jgi:hypothetical protein
MAVPFPAASVAGFRASRASNARAAGAVSSTSAPGVHHRWLTTVTGQDQRQQRASSLEPGRSPASSPAARSGSREKRRGVGVLAERREAAESWRGVVGTSPQDAAAGFHSSLGGAGGDTMPPLFDADGKMLRAQSWDGAAAGASDYFNRGPPPAAVPSREALRSRNGYGPGLITQGIPGVPWDLVAPP